MEKLIPEREINATALLFTLVTVSLSYVIGIPQGDGAAFTALMLWTWHTLFGLDKIIWKNTKGEEVKL